MHERVKRVSKYREDILNQKSQKRMQRNSHTISNLRNDIKIHHPLQNIFNPKQTTKSLHCTYIHTYISSPFSVLYTPGIADVRLPSLQKCTPLQLHHFLHPAENRMQEPGNMRNRSTKNVIPVHTIATFCPKSKALLVLPRESKQPLPRPPSHR